jgi:hypothetical protein
MNRWRCSFSGAGSSRAAGRVLSSVTALCLGLAVAGAVSLLLATPAQADIGPKPSMEFSFRYEIEPVEIVDGQLIECEDEACGQGKPLETLGPQDFSCTEGTCSSMSYGYAPYHRLVITFTDRTRESNVFTKQAFDARFTVTVSESAMRVREAGDVTRRITGSRCCSGLWLTLILETLVAGAYVSAFGLPRWMLGWVPLASAFSLPVVWFVFPQMAVPAGWVIGLSEAFAVVFEAGLMYAAGRGTVSVGHAAALSVVMNAASFLVGMAM